MKKVLFFHEVRHSLPSKVKLVIFISFVPMSVRDRLSKGKIATKLGFHNGEIKRMLEVVELPASVSPKPSRQVSTVKSKKIQPVVKVPNTAPDWEGFVLTFTQHADQHKRKWVGRRTIGKLRDEFHITHSAEQLVKLGWMVSHIADGRAEIGWYSAGEKMGVPESVSTPNAETSVSVSQSEVVLDSRIARAQQLLSEEPALHEEKVRLQSSLKVVEDRLAQIELLKGALDAVSTL